MVIWKNNINRIYLRADDFLSLDQKYTPGKRQSIQQMVLGILDFITNKNESEFLILTSHTPPLQED